MIMMGDELWSTTEGSKINRVDKSNLATMEKADYNKAISVSRATAHPHLDYDGVSYNLGNSLVGVRQLQMC